MKIAVISPENKKGKSTVACMLAKLLAEENKIVNIINMGIDINKFMKKFGVTLKVKDKTKSITQIYKLLQAKVINEKDIIDYATKINNNISILSMVSNVTSNLENYKMLKYMLDKTNTIDSIIVMNIVDITKEIEILDEFDLIINVLTQDIQVNNELEKWKQLDSYKKLEKNKVLYIVNKYDEHINGIKKICFNYNISYKKTFTVSYNPFVIKMCNQGKIEELINWINNKDIRVVELHDEFIKIKNEMVK